MSEEASKAHRVLEEDAYFLSFPLSLFSAPLWVGQSFLVEGVNGASSYHDIGGKRRAVIGPEIMLEEESNKIKYSLFHNEGNG